MRLFETKRAPMRISGKEGWRRGAPRGARRSEKGEGEGEGWRLEVGGLACLGRSVLDRVLDVVSDRQDARRRAGRVGRGKAGGLH